MTHICIFLSLSLSPLHLLISSIGLVLLLWFIIQRTPTNYAQRHGGRSYRSTPGSGKPTTGSNIRGCKDLGGGAPMGGG